MSEPPRAYFFGYWGDGHLLHHIGGRTVRPGDGIPFDPFTNAPWLDGGLAPKQVTESSARRYLRAYDVGHPVGALFCSIDGRSEDERRWLRHNGAECEMGKFVRHYFRGYTLIAWWDRTQGDGRGACNSVFLVEGNHTSHEMLTLWPQCFPLQAANLSRAGVQLREVFTGSARDLY